MLTSTVTEEWRPIPGYEGLYSVSNLGRFRHETSGCNKRAGVPIVGTDNGTGYRMVSVTNLLGVGASVGVHRLVALAFIGPCPWAREVNHIDGVRDNNRLENLEYVTRGQNIRHAYRVTGNKTPVMMKGPANPACKLSFRDVLEIRRRFTTESGSELAAEFGVSRNHIYVVARGAVRKTA